MASIAARNLLANNRDNNPDHLPPIRGGGGGGSSHRPRSSSEDSRQKGHKPQLLVCYLCGQQFGSASLEIHQPQCYRKKMIDWERAEPGKRGPRPKDPATVDLSAMPKSKEEFNNQQFSQFTENLAQCPNCGRKFLADRLEVHLRSCKAGSAGASKPVKGKEPRPGSSASPSGRSPSRGFGGSSHRDDDDNDSPNSERRPKGVKPQMLVCYLCGQQFGSASLEIHMPQCYKKKMIQWERAEPGKRGPRPKDPSTVDLSAMPKSKEEFNNQQFSQFTENLAQCPNCGRKFLADRLEVHLRSCKAGSAGASKPIKGKEFQKPSSSHSRSPTSRFGPPPSDQDDDDDDSPKRRKGEKPMFLVCYLCGQQFGTASLEIHLPQCYVKKIITWERGDPATRGPKPKDPATVDLSAMPKSKEEFNNQQFSEFTGNLSPCPNCGRKFLADRLEVHLRSCKAGSAGASKPVNRNAGAVSARNNTTSPSSPSSPPPSSSSTAHNQQRSSPAQQNQHQQGRPPMSSGGGGGAGAGGQYKFEKPPSNTNNNIPTRLPPKLRALKKLLVDELQEAGKTGETMELDQVLEFLRDVEPSVNDEDADQIINSLDENNDGVIDTREWAKAVKETEKDSSANPLRNRLPSSSTSPAKSSGNTKQRQQQQHEQEEEEKMMFCDSCGEKIPASSQFCPSCQAEVEDFNNDGERREEEHEEEAANIGMLCEECGEVFSEEATFCEECGGKLQPLVPAQHSESMLKNTTHQRQNQDDEENYDYDDNNENYDDGDEEDYNNKRPTPPPDQHHAGGAPARRNFHESNQQQNQQQQKQQPKSSYDFDETQEYATPDDDMTRIECTICGRKFAPESIAKHERVCQKVSSKQRRVFDSSKMRQTGDMKVSAPSSSSSYGRNNNNNNNHSSSKKTTNKEVPKWKQDSMQFRNAMKQARQVTEILAKGGTTKDLPPPTYSENSHYVPCPHCGRKFAPDTAERHIPKCSQTINRPKPPPRRRY